MKILICFMLFLIAANAMVTHMRRVTSAHKANDILGVVGKSEKLKEFWKTFDTSYTGRKIAGNILEVGSELKFLKLTFMKQSYNYIRLLVLEYCRLAWVIISVQQDKTDAVTIRKQVAFPEKLDYCMYTAFHDINFGVGLLFESTFFFQTIHPDDKYPLKDLKLLFEEYIERYYADLIPEKLVHRTTTNYESVDYSLTRIQKVTQEITAYSHVFCLYWKPFLSNNFNKKAIPDDVRNKSAFIQHVFHNEMCVIDVQEYYAGVSFPRREYYYVASQRNWIYDWKCEKILENEEYGIQKYTESVTKRTGKSLNLVKQDKKLFTTRKSDGERRDVRNQYELSIAALKSELKSSSYYLNIVKYYNIVSEVMLMVSIKEGKKIMKAIKHELKLNCNEKEEENGTTVSVDKIRQLKSTLSLFKSVLDKLVFLILDKKSIDVTNISQKTIFDTQVEFLMKLLDVQDSENIEMLQITCNLIPNELIGTAHLGDSPNEKKFEKYYLTEPILNVTELCDFVDGNF